MGEGRGGRFKRVRTCESLRGERMMGENVGRKKKKKKLAVACQ